jgi:hypothetical protein
MSEANVAILNRLTTESPLVPPVKPAVISYKQFKQLAPEELKAGLEVQVDPEKAHATQDWTTPDKVFRSVDQLGQLTPKEVEEGVRVSGFWYTFPATHDSPEHRGIVLGDGHHKALLAKREGIKVIVVLKGPMPENTRTIPFSRFKREAGGVFAEFSNISLGRSKP